MARFVLQLVKTFKSIFLLGKLLLHFWIMKSSLISGGRSLGLVREVLVTVVFLEILVFLLLGRRLVLLRNLRDELLVFLVEVSLRRFLRFAA